ncbi:hypothetical protein Arub01_20940 [Actinomadura rubrobrunea]|uniref:BPL/LPL catalytic domain-containing protein n=2 Tax=Actinomadura rubrobrunea TaxID=115335 RepID=A0A9W6PSU9_9ACTN|nr:hypothetical protein Arub01_20940 [Actinomadura rubrobrunea]
MLSVVEDDTRDPVWNLALDEALARAGVPSPMTLGPGWARAGLVPPPARPGDGCAAPPDGAAARDVVRSVAAAPVLRVWQNDPSVVVGRFQDLDSAVDLAACARDGVRVVRRATGGDAVFTGPGSLLFTLVRRLPPAVPPAAERRPVALPDIDALVIMAVRRLGVPAGLALPSGPGRSPVLFRDGTVSIARLRTRRAVLAHVAVQVTEECALGDRYLPGGGHRRAGTAGGGSLAGHGVDVTTDAVRSAVLTAAVDAYGNACVRRPNAIEQACRDHLYAVRYGDFSWHLTGAPARRGVCWEQICR